MNKFLEVWMASNLQPADYYKTLPERVGIALVRMFRAAPDSTLTTDLWGSVMQNPEAKFLAMHGPAVEFFIRVLDEYGYDSRRIELCGALNETANTFHAAVEYREKDSAGELNQWVFYDPFYGRHIVLPRDMSGEYLGLFDVLAYPYQFWDVDIPSDHPVGKRLLPEIGQTGNTYLDSVERANYEKTILRAYTRAVGIHEHTFGNTYGWLVRDPVRVLPDMLEMLPHVGSVYVENGYEPPADPPPA